MPTVFIVEAEDPAPSWQDGIWFTGRFDGSLQGETRVLESFEDLSLDDALAWGRSRAGRVLIRYGDDPDVHYSAGAEHPPDAPRWPPPGLGPLLRRRHPDDRWRDRTDADDPIRWRVHVMLVPPRALEHTLDELRQLRDAWAGEAARIAASAGALSWDAEELDRFIAGARSGGEAVGWFTYGSLTLRLELGVDAANAGHATAAAAKRLPMPPGWRYEATAEPAT